MATPKIIYFVRKSDSSNKIEKGAVIKATPLGYRITTTHDTYVVLHREYDIFTEFEDARQLSLNKVALQWQKAKDAIVEMRKRTAELEQLQEEKILFTWDRKLNG